MTGITVAIRTGERDDDVSFRFRDLMRLQSILLHPGFVEGSVNYLEAYAEERTVYRGNGLGGPQESGLIAIDLPSRRILSHTDFLNGLGRSSHYDVTKARDGIGAHRSRWENRAAWAALMAEGRVKLRVRWDRGLDDEETTETFWARLNEGGGVPPDYLERGGFLSQPFSLEPLLDIDAAADRIATLERMDGRHIRACVDEVVVDLSPWTTTLFPFTRDGADALRMEMGNLGFPGCEPPLPGWRRWAKELVGRTETEPYLDGLRAESAKAIEVSVPTGWPKARDIAG